MYSEEDGIRDKNTQKLLLVNHKKKKNFGVTKSPNPTSNATCIPADYMEGVSEKKPFLSIHRKGFSKMLL